MLFTSRPLPYAQTGAFSKIVIDYLAEAPALQPFYNEPATIEGIRKIVAQKSAQPIDRTLLHAALVEQYQSVDRSDAVNTNIDLLLQPTTFTVCTAHQPNLFTGPAYFVYKILHAIKLAVHLHTVFPEHQFVPVYYMGSEDADKEELAHCFVQAKKYNWNTAQTGAFGRMKLDAEAMTLLAEIGAQLGVQPHGLEIMQWLHQSYTLNQTIEQATFLMVHGLFKKFGLVVLIADKPAFKQKMLPVFEDDLFNETPATLVEKTGARLAQHYKVQAQPRAINLFYLVDGVRNRIDRVGNEFKVHDTNTQFTADSLRHELQQFPERFSPNVILRGLFQETLLPNVAFIGGGGELAYWLQLKDLFAHYNVVFPALVLRNSFLVIEKKWQAKIDAWALPDEDIFQSSYQLFDGLVRKLAHVPHLTNEKNVLQHTYEDLKKLAAPIDVTLLDHITALQTAALEKLTTLEKKLARAERRRHTDLERQVTAIKTALFPTEHLQERIENISSFYAKWGATFLDAVYEYSPALEPHFTLLSEA